MPVSPTVSRCRSHPSSADRTAHAFAGQRFEIRHVGERYPAFRARRDDRRRERMFARALQARRQSQDFVLVETGRGIERLHFRLALGEGTGLVDDERVTFSMISSASASLISTPSSAPRPMPTITEIGVASPSAHGHAMMSTDTAATNALAAAAVARPPPDDRGEDRNRDHGGYEPGRHEVGEPLNRRPRARRLAHHCAICASSVSAPTFSARIRNVPV